VLAIFVYLFVVSEFARHEATKSIFKLRPAARMKQNMQSLPSHLFSPFGAKRTRGYFRHSVSLSQRLVMVFRRTFDLFTNFTGYEREISGRNCGCVGFGIELPGFAHFHIYLSCNHWMCTCLIEGDCLIGAICSYHFSRSCSLRILFRLPYA